MLPEQDSQPTESSEPTSSSAPADTPSLDIPPSAPAGCDIGTTTRTEIPIFVPTTPPTKVIRRED